MNIQSIKRAAVTSSPVYVCMSVLFYSFQPAEAPSFSKTLLKASSV